MKILKLTSENVKRLQAVEIVPDGNTVIIGGRNGQGKSSVLDSIAYALGGKDLVCEQPVRNGSKKAKIVCQLDDLVVTRTFTPEGGGTLTVTNTDGTAKYSGPQKMLDALVGKLSFDPLEFSRQSARQQLDTLRTLVGVDFTEADARRKKLYDDRAMLNRDIKNLEGQLAGMPQQEAPAEEVAATQIEPTIIDLSPFAAELESANEKRRERDNAEADLNRLRQDQVACNANIANAHAKIKEWQEYLANRQIQLKDIGEAITATEAAVASLPVIDTETIRQKMQEAEATNRKAMTDAATTNREAAVKANEINAKVRSNKARAEVYEREAALTKQADALTDAIDAIDAEKQAQLAAAKFPIEGLSLTESGVSYKGVPFSQCSSAEQLRVSVAMGLAMNPKLKVLLIRDGSLLDADSLKLVAEMAATNDAQVWIERVGAADVSAVIIEDGMVKAAVEAEPELAEAK